MNVVRIFIFIVMSLFCVSCSSNIENAATAQTTDTAPREPQTNVGGSQTNSKNSSSAIAGQAFFKTFIIDNGYPSDSGKAANAEHPIEFTDEPDKIGVYIDGKKKADLKLETNRTKVAADFRESGGVRYFVLIVASAAA